MKKCLKLAIFVQLFFGIFVFTTALKCWTCENARSERECRRQSGNQRITCRANQQTCQSVVRRDERGYRIFKRCKESSACANDMQRSKCRRPRLHSVCRCCCSNEGCDNPGLNGCQRIPIPRPIKVRNQPLRRPECVPISAPEFGRKDCSMVPDNVIGSTCKFYCNEGYSLHGSRVSECVFNEDSNAAVFNKEPPVCVGQCSSQRDFEHGAISCSDGNFVASRCTFTCHTEEGYEIFPADFESNICLDNRTWSKQMPCCFRSCPKYAEVDLAIVMDSSSSIGRRNWKIMKNFVFNLTKSFTISPEVAQISVFRYNSLVDTDSQILFNSVEDEVSFNEAYHQIPYGGRGTFTGQALHHVKDVILLESNGNRRGIRDVVLVMTDGKSQDSVKDVSNSLREQNVLTFAVGINSRNGNLNYTQLLHVAGSEERILIANEGFADLNQRFSVDLSNMICDNQCSN